jgi:hypothetical protein
MGSVWGRQVEIEAIGQGYESFFEKDMPANAER